MRADAVDVYQLPVLGQAPLPVVVQARVIAPVDALLMLKSLPDLEWATTVYEFEVAPEATST